MTFSEKIDKILTNNKLGINSVYGLEMKIGASAGAVNKYYKTGEDPGRGTIKKILDGLNVSQEWWETGSGEIFLTSVIKSTDNKESDLTRGAVYAHLIEQNTDYKLMPTLILTDYKIVPNNVLDQHKQEVERQDRIITKLENLVDRLEKENATLRSQIIVPEKAKQKL